MMPRTTISSKNINLKDYLKLIVRYRILIRTYSRRDLKIKYSQTTFGILWSLFQPLAFLAIFTLFFDKIIHLENDQVSYPIFAFSGIIVWQYFTFIVSGSGNSLIANQEIIKKVYFPKIILPLSKSLSGLFEFCISLLLLFVLMLLLHQSFSLKLLFIPVVAIMVTLIGLSISIWLSALTIRLRDLQHAIPYIANFGIWLTPVFYPVTLIPQPYTNWIYYLNPLAVTLKIFRWILVNEPAPQPMLFLSFIPVFTLLISGIFYFKKIEKQIADYI